MIDQPALRLGIPRDEGVVVAYLPTPHYSTYSEHLYREGKREYILIAYNDMVVDMVGKGAVKWYAVVGAARSFGKDHVEPIWTGPAKDFRVSSLPDVPKPAGRNLAMRCYNGGPWILLEKDNDERDQQLSLPGI